jgi:hypothetical protein
MAPTLPFLTSSHRTEKILIVDDDVEINYHDSSSKKEPSVGDEEEITSPNDRASSITTDKKICNHQDYSSTIVLISSSEDEASVGDGDGNNRGNNATDGAPSDGEEIIGDFCCKLICSKTDICYFLLQ